LAKICEDQQWFNLKSNLVLKFKTLFLKICYGGAVKMITFKTKYFGFVIRLTETLGCNLNIAVNMNSRPNWVTNRHRSGRCEQPFCLRRVYSRLPCWWCQL